MILRRGLSNQNITKNLKLYANEPRPFVNEKSLQLVLIYNIEIWQKVIKASSILD